MWLLFSKLLLLLWYGFWILGNYYLFREGDGKYKKKFDLFKVLYIKFLWLV